MSIIKNMTSTHNPIIKQIAALDEKKYRKELLLFKAEGVRTVTTLLASKLQCKYLLATHEHAAILNEHPEVKERYLIDTAIAQKITSTQTPSGVFGIFHIPTQQLPVQLSAGLVLAQISDPGNFGTLVRTSVAMGFNQIICVETTDPWSPKAILSTAGTIGQADIIQCTWSDLVNHAARPKLCAMVVEQGKTPEQLPNEPLLLVVGNEAHGLSEVWEKACEERLTLPMPGKAESLNAAIAGCIALYELAKRSN